MAKKLLHYLKQKLPSSCLGDLLCSHTFSKHYLRRGGGGLEDEELLGELRHPRQINESEQSTDFNDEKKNSKTKTSSKHVNATIR